MFETELKFQVPPQRRDALHRAVATATAVTTRLQAVYADTADRRLAGAGLALRLRKEGPRWVQTLKGRGDGLMQRLEHEVPLPGQRGTPALDARRHAGTPVGERLLALLADGAPLVPIYRTDIRRLHRRVRTDAAVVELAYDRGFIHAGERRVAVDEIEFELVRGPAEALLNLAQRWVPRHALWWDLRTKSERGYRLALGLDRLSPVKAPRVPTAVGLPPLQALAPRLRAALLWALGNANELASGAGSPAHAAQLRRALQGLMGHLEAAARHDAAAQALRLDWLQTPDPGAAAVADGAPWRGAAFTALCLRTVALCQRWAPPDPG